MLNAVLLFGVSLYLLIESWSRWNWPHEVDGGIVLVMLPGTWSLLREAVDVLLEAAPRGINVDEVRAHILEVEGVIDAHDLHVWTITSGQPVMSAHVVVSDETLALGSARVLDALHECLAHHFDVNHCTFQIEGAGHAERESSRHP